MATTISITELTNGWQIESIPGKPIMFPFFSLAKVYPKAKLGGGSEVVIQTVMDETFVIDFEKVTTPVAADANALCLLILDYDRKT